MSLYNPALQTEAAKLRESGKLDDLQSDPELVPIFEEPSPAGRRVPWPADLRSTAASSSDAVLEIIELVIMWVLTAMRGIRKTYSRSPRTVGLGRRARVLEHA